MAFVLNVIKLHLATLLIALAIYFAPFANDVSFTEFKIPDHPTYPEGEYDLNNAERLFENFVRGPECFTSFKNELYLSAHGGLVYKLVNDRLVKVVKTGLPCDNFWHEEMKCGRPLGIKFDKSGYLYIADTYYGIFKVNMSTGIAGNLEHIVPLNKPIQGKKPCLPNSLDISSVGTLYWTDSSSRHTLNNGLLVLLSDGDGRLIKLDEKTGKNEVLIDNLNFANGLSLSNDESFLIVAETGKSRVLKYNLKGSKSGKVEVFLDNLPGFPDNIHIDKDGNFVISLISPFDNGVSLIGLTAPYPYVRKLAYKTILLFDYIFNYLSNVFPNFHAFSYLKNWVGNFESISLLTGKKVKVFVVNSMGDIVKIHNANDGNAAHISDFIEFNGYYYLGSPYNNYLGRVKANKKLQ